MPLVSVCPGCDDCVGAAHHWIAFVDEETTDPGFACKHCPETRMLTCVELPMEQELYGFDLGTPYNAADDLGEPGGDFAAVALVAFGDDGQRIVKESWRLCIWCRSPIGQLRRGATCGRAGCDRREALWLKRNPNWDGGGRETIQIENSRYF